MYNNESLPFQNKIIGIDCTDKDENDKSIIPFIYDLFTHIYGIAVLIFGEKRTFLNLSEITDKKVIEYTKDIIKFKNIHEHINIIPFPKK